MAQHLPGEGVPFKLLPYSAQDQLSHQGAIATPPPALVAAHNPGPVEPNTEGGNGQLYGSLGLTVNGTSQNPYSPYVDSTSFLNSHARETLGYISHGKSYGSETPYASTTPSSDNLSIWCPSVSDVEATKQWRMGGGEAPHSPVSEDGWGPAISAIMPTRNTPQGPGSARSTEPSITSVSEEPSTRAPPETVYSRIPVTADEQKLKGPAFRKLLDERYGPHDLPGETYYYVRHGQKRLDSKGRVGDARFKLRADGVEIDESNSAFEKRMAQLAKSSNAAKADEKRDKAASEVQEMTAAVDKAAVSGKHKSKQVSVLCP